MEQLRLADGRQAAEATQSQLELEVVFKGENRDLILIQTNVSTLDWIEIRIQLSPAS